LQKFTLPQSKVPLETVFTSPWELSVDTTQGKLLLLSRCAALLNCILVVTSFSRRIARRLLYDEKGTWPMGQIKLDPGQIAVIVSLCCVVESHPRRRVILT
jgi:hypothetical protein